MSTNVNMTAFTEETFQNTCKELDEKDIKGWEYFVESHGVTIYRFYHQDNGLYEYKIYGTLDVSPEICARVYMDTEYRKKWDSYVEELKEVNEGDQNFIYWQVKFPWPLSNRDYVYLRQYRETKLGGKPVWLVLAKAAQSSSLPERSGVVRVTEYVSYAALTSDGNAGTKAFMRYFDNPGGSLPTWLINWGASKGVPQFLSSMQTACHGYPDYLKSLQSS